MYNLSFKKYNFLWLYDLISLKYPFFKGFSAILMSRWSLIMNGVVFCTYGVARLCLSLCRRLHWTRSCNSFFLAVCKIRITKGVWPRKNFLQAVDIRSQHPLITLKLTNHIYFINLLCFFLLFFLLQFLCNFFILFLVYNRIFLTISK